MTREEGENRVTAVSLAIQCYERAIDQRAENDGAVLSTAQRIFDFISGTDVRTIKNVGPQSEGGPSSA